MVTIGVIAGKLSPSGRAFERERRGPEQLKVWQEGRLAYMLQRAATKVPYREHWLKAAGGRLRLVRGVGTGKECRKRIS